MTEIASLPRCSKTYDPKREAEALAADHRATSSIDTMLARGHIRPRPERDNLGAMALIAATLLLVLVAALVVLAPEQTHAALIHITRG